MAGLSLSGGWIASSFPWERGFRTAIALAGGMCSSSFIQNLLPVAGLALAVWWVIESRLALTYHSLGHSNRYDKC